MPPSGLVQARQLLVTIHRRISRLTPDDRRRQVPKLCDLQVRCPNAQPHGGPLYTVELSDRLFTPKACYAALRFAARHLLVVSSRYARPNPNLADSTSSGSFNDMTASTIAFASPRRSVGPVTEGHMPLSGRSIERLYEPQSPAADSFLPCGRIESVSDTDFPGMLHMGRMRCPFRHSLQGTSLIPGSAQGG